MTHRVVVAAANDPVTTRVVDRLTGADLAPAVIVPIGEERRVLVPTGGRAMTDEGSPR